MKTAVVFYSLEGNTKYVCERIAKNLDADLIEIKPVKAYPTKGFMKFFHGGKAAVFGDQPALMPYTFDEAAYDQVIIGSPVWASKCAPPINSFVKAHGAMLKKLGGQQLGVVLCQSGNGAQKVIESYKKELDVDHFHGELVLIDPAKKAELKASQDKAIDAFCEKF